MSAPPRPRGILFDIGGTLLREGAYDLGQGLRLLGVASDAVDRLARELQAAIDHVHASNSAEFTLAAWLETRRERLPAGRAQEHELRFWQGGVTLSPMPGVAAALGAVAERGLRTACVSNAVFRGDTLAAELARHGLLERFAFVLSSADLGIRKPDARIFQEAARRLGLPPSELWFVGDSWENDVRGAEAAGLYPIWLRADDAAPEPDLRHARVGSWDEFARLFSAG